MHNLVLSEHYELIGDPQTIDDYVHVLSKLDWISQGGDPDNYFMKYNGLEVLCLKKIYETRMVGG